MSGKGDKPRKGANDKAYRDNYEEIFLTGDAVTIGITPKYLDNELTIEVDTKGIEDSLINKTDNKGEGKR